MRIIAGKYKGKLLYSIPDRSVRPATDRVKSTIYNMLQNRLGLIDSVVLDLFAGSGSLGFEALSRGAKQIWFVDNNESVLDVIEANAEKLDCMSTCVIYRSDAISFIEKTKNRYDLIFADPPYAYEKTNEIPAAIFQKGLLRREGYLIIEHSKHTKFDESLLYKMTIQKEFGNTRVSFFHSFKW